MDISYSLKKLDESEFSFNYDYDFDSLKVEEILFSFSNDFKIESETESIIVRLAVEITTIDKKTVLVKDVARLVFDIIPFSDVVHTGNGNSFIVNVPGLMETFVSIAIGAVRGFLSKNLKGTPLEGMVLPLIPIEEIKKILKARVDKDNN